ncbi:baseplate assembly protein J [Roseibium sp. TrichSKD4]|uniref:baseplate assembly protein n=1 Tax=Roseibium sp. TrichSKD4 TaxID=744980 RepID=UPI0001E575FD|nr:baseplate J/gp47 family protein [Roseibium sp. TrichSKD4]EFO30932.1 baseplate assembly protein J [Roseibium sp. TrichSKD4]
MSRFDDIIELPGLPAPKLVEPVHVDVLQQRQRDKYAELYPDFEDETEFEPVRAHFGTDAWVESLLRTRINEAASATRLATATGSDLDIIGASRRRKIKRLVLDAGDPTANPPREPVYESDEDYRRRIQLGPESYSTAGPEGAYVFWALSVPGVADATAVSPEPCDVLITILAEAGDGTAAEELLAMVVEATTAKNRRPLADRVNVQSATIRHHVLSAILRVFPGPSWKLVEETAQANIDTYLESRRSIAKSLPVSALHASLQVAGVHEVILLLDGNPIGSGIEIGEFEAAHIDVELSVEVIDG